MVAVIAILGLSWPMILTNSAMAQDWPNHLWLLWQQGLNIERSGIPSLFVATRPDVFYPFYAFYGGTLYALGGLVSVILGAAPLKAYVLTYMMGFGAAIGGFYWLGRMAGVRRWLALAPGLTFVTSSYVLTDVYARGSWPEFMAVCSIPLLAAAALAILRAERLRAGPVAALALSTVVLFGSHNITMLWGVSFLVILTIVLVIAVPSSRSLLRPPALLRLGLVMGPAVLVDAWFLLPAVAYQSRTVIGHTSPYPLLAATSTLVDAHRIFTFSRASAVHHIPGFNDAPDFALGLPILTFAWVLVAAAAVTVRRRGATMARVALACIGVGTLFLILMTHRSLIELLPKFYAYVQFQYRLETYVLLSLAGAMVAVLAAFSTSPRRVVTSASASPVAEPARAREPDTPGAGTCPGRVMRGRSSADRVLSDRIPES